MERNELISALGFETWQDVRDEFGGLSFADLLADLQYRLPAADCDGLTREIIRLGGNRR